jgi:hypothetical protein
MAKKKKELLHQMEMFDEMTMSGLTPNQYYLLCCMHDSVTPLKMNMHLELRNLKQNNWINEDNKLTPQAMTMIKKLEKLFKIQKRKTSSQLMTGDFKENIVKYKTMFPNMKLPSGKAARSASGNLEKNFRWFFENYDFKWSLIFEATARYINEHQDQNWKYMRTSQYFIRKDNLSDLADYCEMVSTGGDEEIKPKHAVKVV